MKPTNIFLFCGCFVVIIIFGIIAIEENIASYECSEKAIITDILDISAGGLGTIDRCIFQTTSGKINAMGWDCNKQIGETLCVEYVKK